MPLKRRLLLTVSTLASKAIPITKATRARVAVCTAILVALSPVQMLADQPVALNISVAFGPIATTLSITPPVPVIVGNTGMFQSTLLLHALDNAKSPPFSADLIAIGQAPDANTLLGAFLPATIIVKQDLLSGATFQSAAAHALSETGVTVARFQDPSQVEYGLLVGLIAIVVASAASELEPTFGTQAVAIKNILVNNVCALDLSSIGGSYGLCPTSVIP